MKTMIAGKPPDDIGQLIFCAGKNSAIILGDTYNLVIPIIVVSRISLETD